MLLSIVIFAQIGGTTTYDFLNISASARSAALAGGAVAIDDDDFNTAIENPALLSDTMDNKVSVNYINYFADVGYGYFGYAKNIAAGKNVSFGLQYLNYGDFIRRDELGMEQGAFSAKDLSFNIAYAQRIKDSVLRIGVTLKTIYSNYDNYTSWGSALDVSCLYSLPKQRFNATLLVQNIGRQWKPYVDGNFEKLPFRVQLAFSRRLVHAPFRFTALLHDLQKWDLTEGMSTNSKGFGDKLMRHVALGSEIIISKNFLVRAGFDYQRRQDLAVQARKGLVGFSFGVGFRIRKFQFNYGRASYHRGGAANNFSVSVDLNSFYRKVKPEE